MKYEVAKPGELAGVFMLRDPRWREKVFFGGLLLLCVPPFGWPAALGYRKDLIARLHNGTYPLLPEWHGRLLRYFFEGIKAMGVIFGYYLPLYAALLGVLLINGVVPDWYWLYAVGFFVCFPIFSTLSLPLAILYWTFISPEYRLSWGIAATLLTAFGAITFFIPAGFLQVSLSERYWSAFNVPSAIRLIRKNFSEYIRAWYHSGVMSLAGHFAMPFSPWGVIWCYLGIIFAFNKILERDSQLRGGKTWFDLLSCSERISIESTANNAVFKCTTVFEDRTQETLAVKIGPTLVPLPSLLARRLST